MGLRREIVGICDLCSRKERFEEASSMKQAQEVALTHGWYVRRKGTVIDFVICAKCREEMR